MILRPYRPEDRAFFLQLVCDPERMRFMDGALDPDAAEDLFASFLPDRPRADDAFVIAADQRRLGHAAFVPGPDADAPEVLFLLCGEAEGRGVATAALHALVERAKARALPALRATADADHPASLRVLEKVGFRRVRRVEDTPAYVELRLDLSANPET